MSDSTARQRRANIVTFCCMGSTVVVIALAVLAETGGTDAGIVFGYIAFLVALFVAAPLHVLAGPVAVVSAWKTGRRGANAWIFGYFALWIAVALAALVASGALQPLREGFERLAYESSHSAETELLGLLRYNRSIDGEALAAVLAMGADVNIRDRNLGWPILVHATRVADAEATQMLLEAGADPNSRIDNQAGFSDPYDTQLAAPSAIVFAAWAERGDRLATLGYLPDAGAHPDPAALLGTCRWSDSKAFEMLVTAGASLNAVDLRQQTCLHFAAGENDVVLINTLIARGADTNARNRFGLTPVDYAVRYDRVDALELLLAAGAQAGKPGDLYVYVVTSDDAFATVQRSGMRKPGIGVGDALATLLRDCRGQAVARLVELGADPNAGSKRGTALHYLGGSSCSNRAELAALLIENGADLERRFENRTPLGYAARAKSLDYAGELIELGADPNAKVTRGDRQPEAGDPSILEQNAYSALHVDTNIFLIQHGATLTAKARDQLIRLADRRGLDKLRDFVDAWPDSPVP